VDRERPTASATVAFYTKHPAYNQGPASFANDIAVVTLAGWSTGTNIGYCQLPTLAQDQQASPIVTGWNSPSTTSPVYLQDAEMGKIPTSYANGLLSNAGAHVWDNQTALLHGTNGWHSDVTMQSWDKGAGVYAYSTQYPNQRVVVGLLSWNVTATNGQPDPTYPTVATRVYSYINWIEANSGITTCGGKPVDILDDANNCGGCGKVCLPGPFSGSCYNGACIQ
jgi:hypothetical protein